MPLTVAQSSSTSRLGLRHALRLLQVDCQESTETDPAAPAAQQGGIRQVSVTRELRDSEVAESSKNLFGKSAATSSSALPPSSYLVRSATIVTSVLRPAGSILPQHGASPRVPGAVLHCRLIPRISIFPQCSTDMHPGFTKSSTWLELSRSEERSILFKKKTTQLLENTQHAEAGASLLPQDGLAISPWAT